MNSNQENVNIIKEHYENLLDDSLLIVGLNDDRGFNLQKSCLTYIKNALKSDKYDIDVFNAFSMFFNKTRHIDYFLDNNISMEEIEQIQKYATISEVKHALGESDFGETLGKLVSKILCSKYDKRSDKDIFKLSTSIENSIEPIIVYSSGINDIMYELCIDPFSVKGYYTKEKDKYNYALDKTIGEKRIKSMNNIISGHESNFERLLNLNSNSRIMVLGAYLYSAPNDYDIPFHDFVLEYNSKLEELCNKYHINYIDLRFLEETMYQSAWHTYFKGISRLISNEIISSLTKSIMNDEKYISEKSFEHIDGGAKGMLDDMKKYHKFLATMHSKDFLIRKEDELQREEAVLEKVIRR